MSSAPSWRSCRALGMWLAAKSERNVQVTEPELAIGASRQVVGGDRLLKAAQDYAVPDSCTLGTAACVQWLNAGMKSGEVDSCNTFAR